MQYPQPYLTYRNNLTNPSTLTTNNLNVSGTAKLNNSTSLHHHQQAA